MENSIVISVNTISERDTMVRDIYKSLTANPNKQYTIQQDRVNRIKIFHNKGSLRILIQTYLIVVLPVLLDFSPLENLYGTVDFRLNETIDRLVKITHRLQSLQGKRVVSGKVGAKDLKKVLTNIL